MNSKVEMVSPGLAEIVLPGHAYYKAECFLMRSVGNFYQAP